MKIPIGTPWLERKERPSTRTANDSALGGLGRINGSGIEMQKRRRGGKEERRRSSWCKCRWWVRKARGAGRGTRPRGGSEDEGWAGRGTEEDVGSEDVAGDGYGRYEGGHLREGYQKPLHITGWATGGGLLRPTRSRPHNFNDLSGRRWASLVAQV